MIRRFIALLAPLGLPLALWFVHRMHRRTLVPQPRGMVLGLYAGDPEYDYHAELDRIAASGATCVSL
ncbi:MAG: hypothetical protein KGI56_06510, partial [Acidobacteriota bacterium]|nr:hypothetical protein [Acidobacteriota bacterium]